MSDRPLWLIAGREGALVLPDDTFAVWFPGIHELQWRDMKMPRGMTPPAKILDRPVVPEVRGWPLPVWREPTAVPAAVRNDARAWISDVGGTEPWPGVRKAKARDIALFLAGKYHGGQPDPAAPLAFAATSVAEAERARLAPGETREDAVASGLARDLLVHELHDFPPKIGGAYTAALRKAFLEARERVRPRSKRPPLGRQRPSIGDPTDRVAELTEALRLENERRERDSFREFLRRLVLRAITPNADGRLMKGLLDLSDKAAWERLAVLVVAVEREPGLFGNPREAARKAKSLTVGLGQRARRNASG